MGVPQTSAAASRDEHTLPLLCKIGEQSKRVVRIGLFVHERADGHRQVEIHARVPLAIRALPMLSAFGREFGVKPVVDERVRVGARGDVHRAAVTAVAAARSPARDPLFAAERETSAASVAGRDVYVDFVDEQFFIETLFDLVEALFERFFSVDRYFWRRYSIGRILMTRP